MGWDRSTDRQCRGRSRPSLERLEARQVLSTLTAAPASSTNPDLKADGTTNFDRVIQASAARSAFQVDGSGQSVAVIDTGVDYKNPALGGSIGPGNKVIAGVDFTGSPNGVLPATQHGTGVAGVIASNAKEGPGVAPGADIVALRVFGDNGQGSFEQVARALDWVIAHHSDYNITAVNLSISDGGNYVANRFAQDGGVGQRITESFKALDAINIPVVVATGNSYDGKAQGEGFSSIIPDAISVTATDVSGVQADGSGEKFAVDAQRLGPAKGGPSATKIAAPGVNILAPSGDSGTGVENGTSFAAPQVSGGIVLLQQYYQKAYHTLPTLAQLNGWLQQGASTIRDPSGGVAIGRLDILRSLQILDAQLHPVVATAPPVPAPVVAPPAPIVIAPPAPVVALPAPVLPSPVAPPARQQAAAIVVERPAPTPPARVEAPRTEIILNGNSIGSYSTSELSAEFAGLFALLKGPVKTLQAWAPVGAGPILGASHPSGVTSATLTTDPRVKLAQHQALDHARGSRHPGPVAHPATPGHAAHKHKKSSFFGLPFFF